MMLPAEIQTIKTVHICLHVAYKCNFLFIYSFIIISLMTLESILQTERKIHFIFYFPVNL